MGSPPRLEARTVAVTRERHASSSHALTTCASAQYRAHTQRAKCAAARHPRVHPRPIPHPAQTPPVGPSPARVAPARRQQEPTEQQHPSGARLEGWRRSTQSRPSPSPGLGARASHHGGALPKAPRASAPESRESGGRHERPPSRAPSTIRLSSLSLSIYIYVPVHICVCRCPSVPLSCRTSPLSASNNIPSLSRRRGKPNS
eukprot:scaffold52186_cov29-Tisochrysis_lutea.AAC.17